VDENAKVHTGAKGEGKGGEEDGRKRVVRVKG
jgi:hypothetical protein